MLSDEQGLSFLEYQGMKTNYQKAFENAFFNFEDVDKVYQDYPAFQNLHERSKALVNKRDELIRAVEQELIAQNYQGNALAEARRQWQNFVATN